jgi:hypothetical protein
MRGSPFFDGVKQVDAAIGGEQGKLPCFYYDASSMTATFPARLSALRALMPDPRYVPARFAPGLGIVAISCLEYRDSDIRPYNELAIAIALNVPGERANLPGRAVWRATRSGQLHAYIQHLPVTTEVALRGGVDFYNFPKFLADIEFQADRNERTCRLAEGHEHILTLRGRRIPATKTTTIQQFCHLWMDGQPQSAEFKVHQHEVGTTIRPGAATLELGEHHPIALELARLLVSRHPLQYEYAPSFEAILYQPEHLTMPLFVSAIERGRELAGAR